MTLRALRHGASILALASVALPFSAAQAAVTISSDATTNMTCSGGVCAPTAADAVLNVGDLETLLASGNVTVTTTGTDVQAKDIAVTAPLSWSAASTLGFDAYRSIGVDAPVSVAGAGGISLRHNDGDHKGSITYTNGNISFANLSSSLVINGQSFILVPDIKTLAADIANSAQGKYALTGDYDASVDGTYFTDPISTSFSGTFDGLGNRISKLAILDATDSSVGLFGDVLRAGVLRNVGILNANVSDPSPIVSNTVAILAGSNNGLVSDCYTSGRVSISDNSIEAVAGLVGGNSGKITNSFSIAAVKGSSAAGLVAFNSGVIDSSYAAGKTRAGFNAGGLVFENLQGSLIDSSHATGKVSAGESQSGAGGLVVINDGWINNSYATGAVASGDMGYAGGLVASMGQGKISESFAASNIDSRGAAFIGGLVALVSGGDIENSYAIGDIRGKGSAGSSVAGGLIGAFEVDLNYPSPSASASYSTGRVPRTNGGYSGGFFGEDETSGEVSSSYWDLTTSGRRTGTGNRGNEPGLEGRTTTQLQAKLPKGFDKTIWTDNPDINGGLPYLIANPPPQ